MGAIKNGIKTTLRTPGKALLFALVLTLLAALLSVALSVFAAVRGYLRDCDAYYHTIVNLEYLGKDYPDGTVYDEALVRAVDEHREELDALCRMEQVMRFEPTSNALAQVEGLQRKDMLSYDPDVAVLKIFITRYDEGTAAFDATIESTLYARKDNTSRMICVRIKGLEDAGADALERGGHYLVCGHHFLGTSNYIWFMAEPMELPGTGITVPACTKCEDGDPPETALYEQLADCYQKLNDSCPVQFSAAIEDQLPFHQQALTLDEGRLFTSGETGVCVISARLAGVMDRSCGDHLRLSVRKEQGSVYVRSEEDEVWEDYEIVGIYGLSDEYPFTIYLPSQAEPARVQPVNGYRLGQFRVQNSEVAAFLEASQPLEQQGFRLTVYDQGYAVAVEPMQDLMLLSDLFLAVCLTLAIAFLCLQCHLFISRQRETAQTMLALGSGRAHVHRYFLGGALLLAIPAGLLGGWIGRLLERRVMLLLRQLTQSMTAEDLRYSSSSLSLARTLDFAPTIPLWIYAIAFGLLMLLAALLTVAFSRGALQDRAVKKKKAREALIRPKLRRSSRLSGPLKYALLSMRRSALRSLAVLLLCLLVALFFGQLTDSVRGYETQLQALRQNTVLSGHATDAAGQKLEGLIVSPREVESFIESGLLRSCSFSRRICHLRFAGIPVLADGTEIELNPPWYPPRLETFEGQMVFEPLWVRSSSVENSALFYYAKPTALEWLAGYGEESFLGSELICALPQTMADEHGIHLGDTARFLFFLYDGGVPVVDTVDLKVVSIYLSATDNSTILSPVNLSLIPTEQAYFGYIWLGDGTYDSFVFTLDDTGKLDEARKALDRADFNYVRSGRRLGSYVVIDDEVYLSTTHSMERQIKYVRTLYACLYAIAGVLSLALAWLLTALRKKELALMRALGTQPVRIVANLHFEQSALCALGLGAGLGIWALLGKSFDRTQLLLTLAFFGIWSLTTLVCVLGGMRKQAYADLAEPE